MLPSLTLYHLPTCPFCLAVRDAAKRIGIELELVDIRAQPWAADYLSEHRGVRTVPVLHIRDATGERLLPESRDIIRYLERLAREQRPMFAIG